ncbi:AraC family transcriptional regulator [Vallitalea okinawensis]|uniref:AraC family transcriptional regulator n=1 Tax=Vallitalea okinawensis TaxID=2078660 RepID=UPI0014797F11|nr:AraC family transcriptional regulator [Vallitalea okinawensis]
MQKTLFKYKENGVFFEFSQSQRFKEGRMNNHHFHPFYEIYYLHKGSCDYLIEGNLYSLNPGDLVVINKYAIHKTLYPRSSETIRYLINFDAGIIATPSEDEKDLLIGLFQNSTPVIRLNDHQKKLFESYLFQMIEYAHQKESSYAFKINTFFRLMIILLKEASDSGNLKLPKEPTEIEEKVLDVANFILKHYDEPITLPYLSEYFYISQHYLSHKFKEITGFTISDYIQMTRTKKAQELILTTDLKIIDISEKCGFGSVSQFRRVFSKHSGMSPRDYRKIGNV